MKYAAITDRLAGLGGAKWLVYSRAKAMQAAGTSVIHLTIGEPDTPPPAELIDEAVRSMQAGRITYSNGQGEPALLAALAARYSRRSGRSITPAQVTALPGTQTALFATLQTLTNAKDEVLVGDPLYATYEGIIAATGAVTVPVPLRPEHGFRMQIADLEARVTPKSRVLFLNSPHNPTGAVLRADDIAALGDFAKRHDLWIISDEVYEELVFPGSTFVSPFDQADLAERVVVTASISKSHAAPGFRSGWAIGPEEFARRMLPVAEAMLFGNQPFIADMTALAVSRPSPVATGMSTRFARRAQLIHARLDGVLGMKVHQPEAGMFSVVDIRATGMTGVAFAEGLLTAKHVAVMPGESFGPALNGWIRISLTQPDEIIETACQRIIAFAGEQS